MPKVDHRASLADLFLDPARSQASYPRGSLDVDRQAVRQARRFQLDGAATKLMVDLAHVPPAQVLSLLANATPPAPLTWIEYPNILAAIRMTEALGIDPEEQMDMILSQGERAGFLIEQDGADVHVNRVVQRGEVCFMMPVGFRVALSGRPFLDIQADDPLERHSKVLVAFKKGRQPPEWQTARVWGYSTERVQADMAHLVGRALCTSHIGKLDMTAQEHSNAVGACAPVMRHAIAALAMLNSVASVEEEMRPAGLRRLNGGMRPYLTSHAVTIHVPKRIRKVVEWARREIGEAAHRKRLHEVGAHYRHLPRQPKTPGWEPVMIAGEAYFRKRIASHLRGNPDLGVVEHQTTLVRGPE